MRARKGERLADGLAVERKGPFDIPIRRRHGAQPLRNTRQIRVFCAHPLKLRRGLLEPAEGAKIRGVRQPHHHRIRVPAIGFTRQTLVVAVHGRP